MTDGPAAETSSWRDLAVARSLDPARARAEKRVQRFLDAAVELMSSSDHNDFTVQQVVDRSGQSLRSFYQYFAGKHGLLLALFEESVRSTAEHLAGVIDDVDDPLERLRLLTGEYFRLCQPAPARAKKGGPPRAMAEFAQQLLIEHPKEAARAFVPLLSMVREALDDAAAAGAIRDDLDHQRVAGVILQSIMFNAFAATISGAPARDEGGQRAAELWELVLHGLAPRT